MDIIKIKCDRCGKEENTEMNHRLEELVNPEGWTYSGELGIDLCDGCNNEWSLVKKAFAISEDYDKKEKKE